MSDPYATLGVGRNSTDAEIKSAYRKLAKQHHPDIGGDQQKFAEISAAYDNIKDAQARQNFEAQQFEPQGFGQSHSPFGHNPFGDHFNDMFEQVFRHRQNPNTSVTFHVDLEDVYHCASKNVNISQPNGISKPVTIKIPRGITHGDQVRYQAMGPNGGDLLVNFQIKPHREYNVQGHHLHKKLNISLKEALIGSEKLINTLDNRGIKLHIKAGTQSGTKLRIPESGLPRRNLPNGDLIIEVRVNIPKLDEQDLNKTLKEILR